MTLFLALMAASAQASVLSTAANGLGPGQFAVITPPQIPSTQDNYPTVWGDSAAWDPINHKLYYVGQGDDTHVGYHFLIYDEATNTFSEGPNLPGLQPRTCTLFNHGYDLNTIDPATGNFYRATHRPDMTSGAGTCAGPISDVYRYSASTNAWTRIPNNTGEPTVGSSYTPEAIAWWPEKNGFIWVYAPTNHIWLYSETTSSWSLFASFNLQAGTSDGIAEYDYVNHRMVVGTSDMMHILNADATHSQIGPLPTAGGVYYSGNGIKGNIVSEPVNGNFIFIKEAPNFPHDHPYFTWNPVTNAQTGPISGKPAPNPVYGATASAVIPSSSYGVIISLNCYTSCILVLYKHAATAADFTPPTTPTNLATTVVSSTQINLAWTASTDASGIGAYLIERCPGTCISSNPAWAQVGTSATNSFSNTGLTASTTYSWRVRARDASANQNLSLYSNIATGTTPAGGGLTPDQDFQARCNAPGVIKCWGFDSLADGLTVDANAGPIVPGDCTTPSGDTSVKRSGASSLRFNLLMGTGGCAPTANIAGKWEPRGNILGAFNGQRFGAGQTFYASVSIRFSPTMFSNQWANDHKFIEFLFDTSSCGNLGIIQGFTDGTAGVKGSTGCGNTILGAAPTTGPLGDATHYCLKTGFFNPECANIGQPYGYSINQWADGRRCDYAEWGTLDHPDCLFFKPNVWYTFKFKILISHDNVADGRVESWVMREGIDTGFVKYLDTGVDGGGYPLIGSNVTSGSFVDTVNLTTYMSFLNSCNGTSAIGACQDAFMWAEELILSRNDIAAPGGTVVDTQAPTVVITSPVPPTSTTTTSPISLAGSASDNIAVSSVTWSCPTCTPTSSTATPQTSGTTMNWTVPAIGLSSGSNTITVISHDAAGNNSTPATLTVTYNPATTYWVRPTGTMSGCTPSATPPAANSGYKSTISAGIGCLASGNLLNIRAGTYAENILDSQLAGKSGSSYATATTIRAYQTEVVTLNGDIGFNAAPGVNTSFVVIGGDTVAKNFVVTGHIQVGQAGNTGLAKNIHFDGMEVKNTPTSEAMISLGEAANDALWFSNMYVHNAGSSCNGGGPQPMHGFYVQVGNSIFENIEIAFVDGYGFQNYDQLGGRASNNIYRNNYVHDTNLNQGINCQQTAFPLGIVTGANNKVYNNIIVNNGGSLGGGDSTNVVVSNTVYNNGNTSLFWCCYPAILTNGGALVSNNIVFNNNVNSVDNAGGTGTNFTNNPLFVNPGGGNFRLLQGSTAINQGLNVSAAIGCTSGSSCFDYAGTVRPVGGAWDYGAFEFVSTGGGITIQITFPTLNPTFNTSSSQGTISGTSSLQ